jgi:hypothetical protein
MVDVRLDQRPTGNTNCYICNNTEGLPGSATVGVRGEHAWEAALQQNNAVLPVARSAITGIEIEIVQSPTGWNPAWRVVGRRSTVDTNVKLSMDPCARKTLAI